MKKLGLLLFAVALLTFIGCDENATGDTEAPTINATLSLVDLLCDPCVGHDINVSVDASDNDALHHVNIALRQSFDDDLQLQIDSAVEVFNFESHVDQTNFSIDTTYTIDTALHSTFYLIVTAEDHNGNTSGDTARIHVHE